MKYFYARVSSKEQNLSRQLAVAEDYNCDRIFCDKQSGKNFERDAYQEMISILQSGDEVIIKELDRLGRNKELVKEQIKWFKDNGIKLRILNIPSTLIDYQGQEWIGDMVNNILIEVLSSMAEKERITIRERQKEGISAMRNSGRWEEYGRPKKEPADFEKFRKMQKDGIITVDEAVKELGISRSTWYARCREVA